MIELEPPNIPRAMSLPFPVPHPRRTPRVDVSLGLDGDRGYVYEDPSTYSLLSVPKPMRTAITSARAMFERVGWMKISSGFDFERGPVAAETV
jgi:hypothetical protein